MFIVYKHVSKTIYKKYKESIVPNLKPDPKLWSTESCTMRIMISRNLSLYSFSEY